MTHIASQKASEGAIFSSLRHREFRLLWIGLIGTFAGNWLQIIAQGWLVLEISDSALFLGLVTASSSLPILIFSLPGGVVADRVDRRKLLLVARVFIIMFTFVLAAITVLGWVNVWYVLMLSFLTGTAWAWELPARQALVPALVEKEELTNAIALNAAVFNASRVLGPGVAGVLVGLVGPAGCFFIAAAGHVVLLVTLLMMRFPENNQDEERASMARDLINGLRYVQHNDNVRTLLILAALPSLFGFSYFTLMPVFARDVLGGGAFELGLLMAATGVGALIASLLIAWFGDFTGQGKYMLIAATLFGLVLILFAFSSWVPLSLVALVGVGGTATAYLTLNNTLLLAIVPESLHGRVMSVLMLAFGLGVIGAAWVGATAAQIGAPYTVAFTGVVSVILALVVAWLKPAMRSL